MTANEKLTPERPPDTWNRARLAILSRVISSSTGLKYPGRNAFLCHEGFSSDKPIPGDLLRLEGRRYNDKWYLAWLVETLNSDHGLYRVASIEDHEEVDYGNVGVSVYDRVVIKCCVEFRYSDAQWAFWDRWTKIEGDDSYSVRPVRPIFKGDEVSLMCRYIHNIHPNTEPVTFPNWREVTDEQMRELHAKAGSALKRK